MKVKFIQARPSQMLRIVGLISVIAALGVAACGGDDDDGGATQSIDLAMSDDTQYSYGFILAQELGYFDEEGLDVSLQSTGGSSEAVQLMASGS